MEAHIAAIRHRSAPAASGIKAASPAPKSSKRTIAPEKLARSTPRKNSSAAFSRSTATPHAPKTSTATASTHMEASIACAALRDRVRPVLMSASPAAANGIRKMQKMQKTASLPEKVPGISGIGSSTSRRDVSAGGHDEAQGLNRNPGDHEGGLRSVRTEQSAQRRERFPIPPTSSESPQFSILNSG